MDYLNDDCLLQIFSHFAMKERVKLEQVCRRWRNMMPYRDLHPTIGTLDILKMVHWKLQHMVKVKHGPCVQCANEVTAFIRQSALMESLDFYLSRLSKSLNAVSFNSSCALACLITPDLIGKIYGCSPNVGDLTFDRCVIMDSAFKLIIQNYHLTALKISYCTFIDSDQCVVIDGCDVVQNLIKKSTRSLTHLEVCGIKRAKLQFSQCCQEYGNLTKVVFSDCYIMASDFKSLIVHNCRTITHLEISCCGSISRFDSIALLKQLTKLTIRQAMISVGDFILICSSCKNISHLRLESCPRLVDLTAVKELKSSMRQFSVIGRSMRINDHVLEDLIKNGAVESLEIIDCVVSDEGFRRVIPFAGNLISFAVKGTGISAATLEAIQNLVNRNRNSGQK